MKLTWTISLIGLTCLGATLFRNRPLAQPTPSEAVSPTFESLPTTLHPRRSWDTSGFGVLMASAPVWDSNAKSADLTRIWDRLGHRHLEKLEFQSLGELNPQSRITTLMLQAACLMYEGQPEIASKRLAEARRLAQSKPELGQPALAGLVYFQGVAALRRGENENCIYCRGASSCILPIHPSAVHQQPNGSREAIQYFTEYLEVFPNDLEAKWLLNVAYMTLGQYPQQVPSKYLLKLDAFLQSNTEIKAFQEIGATVGVGRLNEAGGAIMDDFDNDGLLDIFVTSFSPSEPAALFRNLGNGQFEEPTQSTGIKSEYFSINCMQTDFNNDGRIDIYIPRGAWLKHPLRPTLLRNDGNFSFVDVTAEAGLLDPVNSNAAQWADFDNDGWLDLFVCCEQQPNRLFHNQQNGTFKNVATAAGLGGNRSKFTKGCAWIDYDNDNFPDLFLNHFGDTGQLYHNEKNGTFTDVTDAMGIDGPPNGFSCWAWDYDNDGWLDIFATCYQRTLKDVILGLTGRPHELKSSKLYRNLQGRSFKDVTREVGLDLVFGTMGSNYGDFDNDGYLDMYLGTGEPDVATLIPNRLFKNQAGQKFVEITTAAGVGHLQKGHGIACGDWDRDGHVDIFCQTGGVIPGDKYHNLLFQNPGNAGNWLGLKLIGKSTNRAALGARIKIVTNSAHPQSIYRHISSGSSFGANPLEQTIGLGNCDRILELEIQWPTSGTSQKFKDLGVNQTLEIIESSAEFKTLERSRISWHSFASNAGGRESATPKKR